MNSSLVYLTQTDTTVGFLSQNDKKLCGVKERDQQKKILQVVNSFHTLKKHLRVPTKYKKLIRRARMSTFIYPNKLAFRVVDNNSSHQNFLLKFHTMYSTSANKTQNSFNEEFAEEKSDIIVYTKDNFTETKASNIFKINKSKIRKIR